MIPDDPSPSTLSGVPLSHVFQFSNIGLHVHTFAQKYWQTFFPLAEDPTRYIQGWKVAFKA
jgi:hypothetical protein